MKEEERKPQASRGDDVPSLQTLATELLQAAAGL